MSDLIVETIKINNITPLEGSDNLVKVKVKGWTVIKNISEGYNVGDLVVYFPVDSILKHKWSDKWGITKYLKNLPKSHKQYGTAGRLYTVKLRGEPSYGYIERLDREWPIGADLKDYYEVEKYEPDPVYVSEETERDNSLFHKYTDIQNIKNFPLAFTEEDYVAISEKQHGFNSRVGFVKEGEEKIFMAGSHNQRKKEPATYEFKSTDKGLYWFPLIDEELGPKVKKLLTSEIFNDSVSVILFGEGLGKQDLKYGYTGNSLIYRAFDISVDGKYLDHAEFKALCLTYGIPMVPELYCGLYSEAIVRKCTDGNTMEPGVEQIREGCVIKSVTENFNDNGNKNNKLRKYNNGRRILKSISDAYTFRKNGTEKH